jgi:hypothetical protein
LRYSTETNLSQESILKEAITYFRDFLGLEITNNEKDTVCFEGGGGHITIIVFPGKKTVVEIETQEWDADVKKFMLKIKK